MIKKIKQKLYAFGGWCKRNVKKVAIALGIVGIAMAAGLGGPPDTSFENLPNVAKEQGLYRISFDKWSDVEISDKDMPEVKLRKWGEETFIKISYPDFTPVSPKQDKGKLKWVNGNKEVHLYPLEPREFEENGHQVKQLENGGFEFEVILKKKPATNKIVLNIETQGLKFAYQPELQQWEIDGGNFRPENTLESYAVFHATKGNMHSSQEEANKYKVGKAFHIYRPKIIDSNGWEVWGELHYDEEAGILTTTIPQDFIDNAVYPISTGTTNFGYEEIVAGWGDIKNAIRGVCFDSGGTGTGVSISIGLAGGWTSGEKIKAGLYVQDGGGYEATTEERDSGGANDTFHTFDFSNGPSIEDTAYCLAGWSDSTVYMLYAFVGGGTGYAIYDAESYGTWPLTETPAEGGIMYSIYCTYTPSGNGAAAPVRRRGQIINYLWKR